MIPVPDIRKSVRTTYLFSGLSIMVSSEVMTPGLRIRVCKDNVLRNKSHTIIQDEPEPRAVSRGERRARRGHRCGRLGT